MSLVTRNGLPTPFGATVTTEGINFAVFSQNATAVWLELFDHADDAYANERLFLDPKRNRTGDIWHVFIDHLVAGQLYGWRVDGPYRPRLGHRFNVNKLLIDPYARAICGSYDMFSDALYGYDRHSALRARSFSTLDSGAVTSKSVALANAPMTWDTDQRPFYSLEETVIYECHVKGMTAHPSSLSAKPGTYIGLCDRIPHLKKLGITTVELLPVAHFNDLEPPTLIDPITLKHHKNYWGYATIGFFSPHPPYAFDKTPGAAVAEFRTMVRSFHEAQIEIILDVVFNHSGEGNENGPSIAFRGLDNAVFYMLDDKGNYANYTGCGNTMNCNHPAMKHLIIECLRYWVVEMHVDGFRFDLATILGRSNKGEWINDPNLGLLSDIASDPVLRGCKLIAEAWDAAGLYKLGRFPPGWAEWNGMFRDDVRRFWRGDNNVTLPLARRISGSKDIFVNKLNVSQSINFITAHDGFTLRDLCSYEKKHNLRNGENNRDGCDTNFSSNLGIEGETDDLEIIANRLKRAKNMMATLILARGTPMILGGDEVWRTQNGNNNGFCQDNDISWINWTQSQYALEMERFTTFLLKYRKRFKALRQTHFCDPDQSRLAVDNMRFHGINLTTPDWTACSHSLAFELLDGPREPRFYVAMNAWNEPLAFELPKRRWYSLVDTSLASPDDIVEMDNAPRINDARCIVQADSLRLLISQ